MSNQLIVIGGGAAGFFCAVNAARINPGLTVTIIEKSNKLLSKVRVSGGGRCNVTHACFDIDEMSRHYPRGQHFVKKAFHHFFATDTIRWFEDRNVKLKTEPDGRMFPVSDSSQTIIDCLLNEANKYDVRILMQSEVSALRWEGDRFVIDLLGDRRLEADQVCIATGGYPKSTMFHWLEEAGHSIEPPVPSLFTFNLPKHPICSLMGISTKAKIKISGTKLESTGAVLITHWGLSGPAILRLSAWGAKELAQRNYEFTIQVNWIFEEGWTEQTLREKLNEYRSTYANRKIAGSNFTKLPQRLWLFLLEESGINGEMRFADLPRKTENLLIKYLTDHPFSVKGKTTFKEEFVTAGGIRLSEVDPSTMMSKNIPRLFFAGEVLDVDGITGGFNFQHAWTSGWVAAKSIAG